MISRSIEGVDFICANTDAQALSDIASKTVLQMGGDITKGLGAGANPEIGRRNLETLVAATLEATESIQRFEENVRGNVNPKLALAALTAESHEHEKAIVGFELRLSRAQARTQTPQPRQRSSSNLAFFTFG